MQKLLVFLGLALFSPGCYGQQNNPFSIDVATNQIRSGYVHGTVDVVISTREGFVLATDSRGTRQSIDGRSSFSDDQQKAFPVGQTSACVVAGLIGSDMSIQGFEVRSAIGSHLVSMDRTARDQHSVIPASELVHDFWFGLQKVAGIQTSAVAIPHPAIVAAISAVSVSANGDPEWVTADFPVDSRRSSSGVWYNLVGSPALTVHRERLGLRFDVDAIGMPAVVDELMKATKPSATGYSQSPAMKLFYSRKQEGVLDKYTLNEAIALAKALVAATIAANPPDGGVGGPIDVLTVTKTGVHWIQKKDHSAPFPPPLRFMSVVEQIRNGSVPLDGGSFVSPMFENVDLIFSGEGDTQIIAPIITGTCRLHVLADARKKMPLVVERLERALSGKCEIIEKESGDTRIGMTDLGLFAVRLLGCFAVAS